MELQREAGMHMALHGTGEDALPRTVMRHKTRHVLHGA